MLEIEVIVKYGVIVKYRSLEITKSWKNFLLSMLDLSCRSMIHYPLPL